MSCTDTTKLKGEFEAQLKDADTKITKVKEELVKLNEYRTKLVGGLETLALLEDCLLYTSPSPRDVEESRMPSSA